MNLQLDALGNSVAEQLRTLQVAVMELNERSHVQSRTFEGQLNALKERFETQVRALNGRADTAEKHCTELWKTSQSFNEQLS